MPGCSARKHKETKRKIYFLIASTRFKLISYVFKLSNEIIKNAAQRLLLLLLLLLLLWHTLSPFRCAVYGRRRCNAIRNALKRACAHVARCTLQVVASATIITTLLVARRVCCYRLTAAAQIAFNTHTFTHTHIHSNKHS